MLRCRPSFWRTSPCHRMLPSCLLHLLHLLHPLHLLQLSGLASMSTRSPSDHTHTRRAHRGAGSGALGARRTVHPDPAVSAHGSPAAIRVGRLHEADTAVRLASDVGGLAWRGRGRLTPGSRLVNRLSRRRRCNLLRQQGVGRLVRAPNGRGRDWHFGPAPWVTRSCKSCPPFSTTDVGR